MATVNDSSKGKQILSLLLVIGSSLAGAIFFALAMLYYYNPTGSYMAKNVLLSPQRAQALHFVEQEGGKKQAVFDGIGFRFYDATQKKWQQEQVNLAKYGEFYTLIGEDVSLKDVDEGIKRLFLEGHPSHLTINIRIDHDRLTRDSKPFLQADFVENGSYYRIQLLGQDKDNWAYFFHPDIAKHVYRIFTET